MSIAYTVNETRRALYRRQGYWGDASLADYWQLSVLSAPEKLAVTDWQGARYTYAELDDAAARIAQFLHEYGIQPNDTVAIQLPGWAEFTIILLACFKIGAVAVPLLPNYRETETSYILNKCRARILFIAAEFKQYHPPLMLRSLLPRLNDLQRAIVVDKTAIACPETTFSQLLAHYQPLREPIVTQGDALAAILFTSGTEGFPKGVMLTHNNIIASERAYCAALNLTYQDTLLMPAPLAHATGFLHGVITPFIIGASSVLLDIFSPQNCLMLLNQEKCTCIIGATPFVCDILCSLQQQPYDISSLRFFLCGGTTVPKSMVEQCLKAGFKLISVYGATESAPHTMVKLDDPITRVINTDGTAVPGVEVKIVDQYRRVLPAGIEGEEASRGPNVFVGYLDEPELSDRVLDQEGWYYSGDLCRMDQQGYLKITGRKKDVIIRGGENISSREVEDILLRHPNVREASVVAMPDERLGERACAYVVLKDIQHPLTFAEMFSFFAKKQVAKYKYPERLELVASLPRTASGKVMKHILRDDIKHKLCAGEKNSSAGDVPKNTDAPDKVFSPTAPSLKTE